MDNKYLLEISASNRYLTNSDIKSHLIDGVEHRFKVIGENRVVAVVVGSAAVERIVQGVEADNPPGTTHTSCIPIIPYETFAKNSLGVTDDELEKKGTTPPFSTEDTLWIQVDVNYQGHTLQELRQTWHDEALVALRMKYSGAFPITVYKATFMKQIQCFSQCEELAVDKIDFQEPLYTVLGDQLKITTRRVKVF